MDNSIDLSQGDDLSPVQEFYNNSKILITGGTGFLGNLLLEKLLRSCPVSTIYLLVRPKRGKEMNTRLDELFDDPVFQRMKNHCPKFREKIVGIEGDCAKPNLGLSPQDLILLTDEVDIVFHVAATVRFDEKLKSAVAINVCATQDLLRIAKKMSNLKSFVHVSTTYCNCVHNTMEEKIYPPALDSNLLISMTENISDEILENITPSLVGKYPNTYTYTKQIAEAVVKQESENLSVGIYRPAIGENKWQLWSFFILTKEINIDCQNHQYLVRLQLFLHKEPVRGWINNIYGLTGVMVAAGLGLLRVLHCDSQSNGNIVPADMCVNGLIVMAFDIGQTFEKAKRDHLNYDIPVSFFESSNDKPINWNRIMNFGIKLGLQYPSMKCVWYYSFSLFKSYPNYLLMRFLLHIIPAIIVDGILVCSGKSMRFYWAHQTIKVILILLLLWSILFLYQQLMRFF